MKKRIYGILLVSLLTLCGCSQSNISSSSSEKEFWKITEEEYSSFLKLCEETNFTFINTDWYHYNDKGEIGYKSTVDNIMVFQFDFPNQRSSRSSKGVYDSVMANPKSTTSRDQWISGERRLGSSSWLVGFDLSNPALAVLPFPEYNEFKYDNEKHAYGLTYKDADDSDREYTDYYYFENGKMTKVIFEDWIGGDYPHVYCTRYITSIGTTVIDVPDEETINAFLDNQD